VGLKNLFISVAIFSFCVMNVVAAQDQNPPYGMDKGVWVLKEKKPDFEPAKDDEFYFNNHVSASGNSANGGWSWKDDPVKPKCSGEVWGTCSWEEIPSVIQPGVGQNTTLKAEVGGSQSCAYRHVSARTELAINDRNLNQIYARIGYATSDPKPAPVSIKVPWQAPWGKIGDKLTITVIAQVPGAVSSHFYYNYIYAYEAKAPSTAPNIPEVSPEMEIGEKPQTQETAKENDEPCPGKCIDSGARFSSISREVEVQHCWDNEDSRSFAHPGTVLCVGDHILTGDDSNAVVTFSDLSTLMVKPESEIVVAAPPAKAGKLEIIYGRIKMNVQKVLSGDTLEIKSNLATCGIKGTTIVCEVTESSSTLKVLEGTASFTAKATGEKILLSAGKMATATKSGLAQPRTFDVAAEKASWEKLVGQLGRTEVPAAAPSPAGNINLPPDQALLGRVWRVTEYGGWTATWTRRGGSSVFDGVWFNGSQKVTGMLTMAVQGRVVRIQSRQQTNGYDVDYEGTLSQDGRSIQGTLKVLGPGGIYDWKAAIEFE
jgi:hypothetical protein